MRVYIASHCRWAGLYCASVLIGRGHEISSRWLFEPFLQTQDYTEAAREAIARMDYEDVVASDALLLVAGPDRYSGGKFVEVGIAVARDIPVTILGRRENMLMWLPSMRVIDTPQQFGAAA